MRVREEQAPQTEHHVLAEISVGVRYLATEPILRRVAVAVIAMMSVIGMAEPAIFAVVDDGLGQPVEFIALLVSVQGVGSIIGGIAMMALIRRLGPMRPLAFGLFMLALATLGIALPSLLPVFVGCSWQGLVFRSSWSPSTP